MGRTDMKTIRSILQFRYDHQLSMAEIARASRVSQGTVHNILSRARGAGLDRWPLPEGLDDAALRRALYPPDPVPEPDDRLEPDWSDAVKELTRKREPREPKPTRLVLWERYCDDAREAGMPAYSYSRYCERLAPQLPGSRSQASMRFTYAPGECLFTDFAGRTLRPGRRNRGGDLCRHPGLVPIHLRRGRAVPEGRTLVHGPQPDVHRARWHNHAFDL